jgi:hypothetical protein
MTSRSRRVLTLAAAVSRFEPSEELNAARC